MPVYPDEIPEYRYSAGLTASRTHQKLTACSEFVDTAQHTFVFANPKNTPVGRSLYSFDPFVPSERGLPSIPELPF
jgi:hypothetical protein